MAKVDRYPEREPVSGEDKLYLFNSAARKDFHVSLSDVMVDLFGTSAQFDVGTGPGEIPVIGADGYLPLSIMHPATLTGGGTGGGSGDIVGPATVVDGRVALWDGTTGKVLKQSAALLGTAAWQNVGTSANNVVQIAPDGKLPALDGSRLFNVPGGGAGGAVASVNGYTGAVVLSAADIGAASVVTPESYAGSTEDKLQAAATAAITQGKPLHLSSTYTITTELEQINVGPGQRLDVRGPGKILIAADVARPIVVNSVWPSPSNVTALSLTTFTMDGGSAATECIAVTAPGHAFAKNDIAKLVSDDPIPGEVDNLRRLGEFFRVGAVAGDIIYLAGRPIDNFTTGIRIQKVPRDRSFSWIGPTIDHTPGQLWQTHALTVRGFVNPRVNAKILNGCDCGLQTQSCIAGEIDLYVENMTNAIVSSGTSGYGAQDNGGWLNRWCINGVNARHFWTTGSHTVSAPGGETYLYGRTVGCRVTGSVMGSTSAAFDTHSGAYDCVIHDASVTGGSAGENGSGVAYQLRGRKCRVVDCSATGSAHGVQFWAHNPDDGHDLSVENFTYQGSGDAIRLGTQGTGSKLRRPKIFGGRLSCGDNLRAIYATSADVVHAENVDIVPTGSASGSNAIVIGSNVETVWLEGPKVDTRSFTGASFDLVAFSSATLTDVTIMAPSALDDDSRLRSWANGNGATDVTVKIGGRPRGIVPTGGDAINTAGLDVQFIDTNGLTVEAFEAVFQEAVDLAYSPEQPSNVGDLVIEAITARDPEKLFSPERLLTTLEEQSEDAAGAPRLGQAFTNTFGMLSAAAIQLWQNTIGGRLGRHPLFVAPSVAEGSVLVKGPQIDTNVAQAIGVPITTITPLPNAFYRTNANSLGEYHTDKAAALILEAAGPFSATPQTISASGAVSYNAYAVRQMAINLTGPATLSPVIWENLGANSKALLRLNAGAANRTVTITSGGNGLDVVANGVWTSPSLSLESGKSYIFEIGRWWGNKPYALLLGVAGAADATPSTVEYIDSKGLVSNGGAEIVAFTGGNRPTVAVNDLALSFAIHSGTGTQPTSPAGWTDLPIGGDANGPSVRASYKVIASGSEALEGWTGARFVHLVIFRKAGGVPTVGTAAYQKVAYAAGANNLVWPEVTLPQAGLLAGILSCVLDDTGVLRPQLTLRRTLALPSGGPSRSYLGVSDALTAQTFAQATTEKVGGAGRAITAVVPIY